MFAAISPSFGVPSREANQSAPSNVLFIAAIGRPCSPPPGPVVTISAILMSLISSQTFCRSSCVLEASAMSRMHSVEKPVANRTSAGWFLWRQAAAQPAALLVRPLHATMT